MRQIIHRGEKYQITTDGLTAFKTDGNETREMPYYPERDAAAIAGELTERDAWILLGDLSEQIPRISATVCPEHVLITDTGFHLADWSESQDFRCQAPEGYDSIWALGATTFYLFMGCYPFHGLGGKGQTKRSPIPVMRKEMPQLSTLVARCLAYDPAERPTLEEIRETALTVLEQIQAREEEIQMKKTKFNRHSTDSLESYWPERMELLK